MRCRFKKKNGEQCKKFADESGFCEKHLLLAFIKHIKSVKFRDFGQGHKAELLKRLEKMRKLSR